MALFTRCWNLLSKQMTAPLFHRSLSTAIVARPPTMRLIAAPLTISTLLGSGMSLLLPGWNYSLSEMFSSVMKKRKTKMNHHKWRKRNKAKRFKTKAHNQ